MNLQSDSDLQHILLAAPISPGKAEGWRRLSQEMAGWQGYGYVLSRRAWGIRAESLWLVTTGDVDIAIMTVVGERPERLMVEMVASERPFDRWLCQQIAALLDVNIKKLSPATAEKVLTWKEQPYGMMPEM